MFMLMHQVIRLEGNSAFARAPGMGARLAAGLRAAIRGGGCRHLWSLSVTLDDFDGSHFPNAPRKGGGDGTAAVDERRKEARQRSTTGSSGRGTAAVAAAGRKVTAPPTHLRMAQAHPMNALGLARAFHPGAPDGGAGALLNEGRGRIAGGGTGGGGGGRGGDSGPGAGAGRGAITSLGLPYARLHPRSVEAITAHAISSLTHLDLSFCFVGPAGACALALGLEPASNDNSDDIGGGSGGGGGGGGDGGGGGGGGGGSSGGTGLRGRGSRSLRSLKLPHNAIGDSGACALARALSSNRCLTYLSLASNGINFAGGRALASAFSGDAVVLARLDVGDNPLGEKSSRMLVEAAAMAATRNGRRAGEDHCCDGAGGGGGGGGRDGAGRGGRGGGSGRVEGAGNSGGGDGGGAAVIQILGLDRVAGATSATREAARNAASVAGECETEEEGMATQAVEREVGVGRGAAATAVTVKEEVTTEPEGVGSGDGLAEVTAAATRSTDD